METRTIGILRYETHNLVIGIKGDCPDGNHGHGYKSITSVYLAGNLFGVGPSGKESRTVRELIITP